MSSEEMINKSRTLNWIIRLLDFLLAVAIIISIISLAYWLILPNADEHDSPNIIDVNEKFPWSPNILTNGTEVLKIFTMGVLRHLALIPEHVDASILISMVGYVFFIWFLIPIKEDLS